MRRLELNVIRSRSLTGDELVDVINQFEVQYAKPDADFERTNSGSDSFDLCVVELPSLEVFRRCANTTLTTRTSDVLKAQTFSEFTRAAHSASLNHAWATYYACYSDEAIGSHTQDLSISAGLRREGFFAGVDVSGPSPVSKDQLRRGSLFQEFISEMGLSDHLRVYMDGDTLRMKSQEPWKLVYSGARIDGGKPSGFYACGFDGIESALAAGQRLVERYAKKQLGVGFSVRLPGDAYNRLYPTLNQWHGWEMMLIGCPLTDDALAILGGGDITNQSPPFIPAFYLRDSSLIANVYCSVIVNRGRRCLEVTADNGTLEQLNKRVSLLKDVDFEPVASLTR
jgi:hypothetical protein